MLTGIGVEDLFLVLRSIVFLKRPTWRHYPGNIPKFELYDFIIVWFRHYSSPLHDLLTHVNMEQMQCRNEVPTYFFDCELFSCYFCSHVEKLYSNKIFWLKILFRLVNVMRCAIWYHLYNLENVKNRPRPATLLKVLLLQKLRCPMK